MANITQVTDALEAALEAVSSGIVIDREPVDVKIGYGWPGTTALQNTARNGARIGIVEKASRPKTRWMPRRGTVVFDPTGITATIDNPNLGVNGTAVITIASQVNPNDALGLVLTTGNKMLGAVANAGNGDTLDGMATKLAADINTRLAGTQLDAVAAGSHVTITNNSLLSYQLKANVGNIGQIARETGRLESTIQIAVWTKNERILRELTVRYDPVLQDFQNTKLLLSNGERGTVLYQGSVPSYEDLLKDIVRRNFLLTVEYSLTTFDTVYQVVAPLANWEQ